MEAKGKAAGAKEGGMQVGKGGGGGGAYGGDGGGNQEMGGQEFFAAFRFKGTLPEAAPTSPPSKNPGHSLLMGCCQAHAIVLSRCCPATLPRLR